MPLTDTAVRNAKYGDGKNSRPDGGGLSLVLRPTGAKLWHYRYRIGGRENVFSIGEYFNDRRPGHVSLDDARRARDEAKQLVKRGIHPGQQRKVEKLAQRVQAATTFEGVAREWIERKQPGWTPYYAGQVEGFLAADVFPVVGALPIREVTSVHLLDILRRVEARGATTVALLLRQWCSAIFRYAVATLRADTDPAAALRGAVTRRKVKHKVPLTLEQIANLRRALDNYGGNRETVIALHLLLLTFVRPVELRAAKWSEIDFGRAEWRVPAERMKMREAHVVSLSRQSLRLLRELHSLTGHREFLFPNTRRPKDCMSAMTFNRALERLGFNGKDTIGFSAHGFRTTASTILNGLEYNGDHIERQLAHQPRNRSRAAYNHALYTEQRRVMMQQWADLVEGGELSHRVVPINRVAA